MSTLRLLRAGVERHKGLAAICLALFAALLVPKSVFSQTEADAVAQRPIAACGQLEVFRFHATRIDTAVAVPEGTEIPLRSGTIKAPAHCLVRGVMEPRIGVDGKPYGIHFEMRLPNQWNGRFLFQGGGGTNGTVVPATGSVKGPAALNQGFAVITQDAGHAGRDAAFGIDQQARIDHISRSYDRVTALGKQLVEAYYGKAPDHSYFMGCSEGGREAMLVSQRLPLEYDGVVAGDPGFLLGVTLEDIWSGRALDAVSPRRPDGGIDRDKAFSDGDLRLIADEILKQCDVKDGLVDGIIENWPACKPRLAPIVCKGVKTDRCISKAQKTAITLVFNGGADAKGRVMSLGFPYDTGIAEPGWRPWKLSGTAGPGAAAGAVKPWGGLFLTPFDPSAQSRDFDLDRDGWRLQEVGGQMRADGVMYSTFKQRGSKLLVYTGASDPVFSANELVAWYRRLQDANGGAAATSDFARLFVVPGQNHCGGGKAMDDFDPLRAVVDWAEKGVAPSSLLARGAAFPGRTRPICPYPHQARYKGAGWPIEDAGSFECRPPGAVP